MSYAHGLKDAALFSNTYVPATTMEESTYGPPDVTCGEHALGPNCDYPL